MVNIVRSYPMLNMIECECTDNVWKENYVCTIFTLLITFHVNSQLNGFHNLMVFTIIVFQNTMEKKIEKK